jgi:hypothetical protein
MSVPSDPSAIAQQLLQFGDQIYTKLLPEVQNATPQNLAQVQQDIMALVGNMNTEENSLQDYFIANPNDTALQNAFSALQNSINSLVTAVGDLSPTVYDKTAAIQQIKGAQAENQGAFASGVAYGMQDCQDLLEAYYQTPNATTAGALLAGVQKMQTFLTSRSAADMAGAIGMKPANFTTMMTAMTAAMKDATAINTTPGPNVNPAVTDLTNQLGQMIKLIPQPKS